MADTLATIRSRVAFKCGNKANVDSYIDENINEAILQVIQEAQPQEMWASTTWSASSGTASYAFSTAVVGVTDVLVIKFIRDNTNDFQLKGTSYEVWDRYSHATAAADLGQPHLWTRYGNNVILFAQIPDSSTRTMQIVYIKRPTRLSAVGDTFPLNDEWKRPVEELAAALTLRDLNSSKAAEKFAAYEALMSRRLSIEGEESASPEGAVFIPTSNLNMSS